MPEDGPKATPLGFLLGVMRKPDTPPHLRMRAASVVAPYIHAKGNGNAPPTLIVEDQFGFDIDPSVARAYRDERWRVGLGGRPTDSEPPVGELEKAPKCPVGYGIEEANADHRRLRHLDNKRRWLHETLTDEEDAEEAHLLARVAGYRATPEAQKRERDLGRISELQMKSRFGHYMLSPEEAEELQVLEALYPPEPLDPEHPLYASRKAMQEALEKYKADNARQKQDRRN